MGFYGLGIIWDRTSRNASPELPLYTVQSARPIALLFLLCLPWICLPHYNRCVCGQLGAAPAAFGLYESSGHLCESALDRSRRRRCDGGKTDWKKERAEWVNSSSILGAVASTDGNLSLDFHWVQFRVKRKKRPWTWGKVKIDVGVRKQIAFASVLVRAKGTSRL